ncbi:MAG: isoprenylcysteine carboxylmethyltransferase family protein [Alphaproteobacteria bacterium]|nr:isoprenylcysteine carboxylmethyltransferase family protein [Alphaproteobacteria bacterium]MCZ6838457.1 isoprenylcysteine carboxylmethyltransferase family protein [Alphaproteobacteria bacterium]
MIVSVWHILVALIVLQRLVELAVARINTRRLLAAGGVEHGAGHYPLMVALHVAWLVCLAVFVPADAALDSLLFLLFLLTQAARVWVIVSLGRYWTTRVIAVPSAPLVARGPYRWLRHPNYLIVVAEIALVPLIAGAWEIAAAFSIANAAMLWHRIRIENAALAGR